MALQSVVVGKDAQVRRAFAAMLSGGHVLLEDLPGVGKTTLAKGLSRILGGTFQRVQGTNDLLPSDLLGVHLWDAKEQGFRFQPGPVFCHVLLLDELNRIGPKTQSAMLEAMVEGQVTLDRSTHQLPDPFSSSRPRIRWIMRAPSRCRKASWTASPAPSTSVTRTGRRNVSS
jgi:MoxR-like ATPase